MRAKNYLIVVMILAVLLCGCQEARSGKASGLGKDGMGVILENGGRSGTVTGNYGTAIHGDNGGYDSEEYLGRTERGARIELLDRNVMEDEFGKPIVKIKAEATGWRAKLLAILGLRSDTIGWVNLADTSFAEWFEDKAEAGAVRPVVGAIVERGGRSGTVTGTYGCAIHGSGVHYTRRFNLGRAAQGARIELLERDVIKNKFRMPIIKVKTLEASGTVAAGAVGWVRLSETSFAASYQGKSECLDAQVVIGRIRETEGTQGTVTAKYGAEMRGSNVRYNPDLDLGRLQSGARIELVDVNVIESKFGKPIIKVKALTGEWTVAVGAIGWVNLADTSFAGRFTDGTESGSGEEGKE